MASNGSLFSFVWDIVWTRRCCVFTAVDIMEINGWEGLVNVCFYVSVSGSMRVGGFLSVVADDGVLILQYVGLGRGFCAGYLFSFFLFFFGG